MSKIGTVNLQNCKIGTGIVSKIVIGTQTFWSNVAKSMPPFNLSDWFISGGSSTGSYSLTLSNGKLVQSLVAYNTNWNNCTITSNELRTARQISINYSVGFTAGSSSYGGVAFVVEAKNGNTWTEVARKGASCITNVGGSIINSGTYTDTINVSTTATRMRIKVEMSLLASSGNLGVNLTYNNINFS